LYFELFRLAVSSMASTFASLFSMCVHVRSLLIYSGYLLVVSSASPLPTTQRFSPVARHINRRR